MGESIGLPETSRSRVEALATRIMIQLRAELIKHPPGNDNILVALNALAVAVGIVLAGIDDPRPRQFFARALRENITALREN